ncbi:hypothetical protein LSH36_25g01019 [Paralvinella palmiformis]|uniref:Ethanolaminephosphotransferase 1 n=1 Tax=Paralvinella palmiformis TaxID=53620 RepID=A0AAD9KAG5_9ANNE|nr:hypothetical protein LSH36_25g01019 [Paralvinella palmiformis]
MYTLLVKFYDEKFKDLFLKYNAVDTSPISRYITHPFWNWIVQFYPKWIAPNVLTLAGFLLYVLMWLVLTCYDNDFNAADQTNYSVPRWAWLLAAWYGTDGKQARRTKTSGPLGEMFDHGLDSWATHFMPVCLYSVFDRGEFGIPAERAFALIVCVWAAFIVTHWEKYNTGVLYLPWGYDISQISMVAVFLFTFIFGVHIYKITIPIIGLTPAELSEMGIHFLTWAFSVPVSLWNVYCSYRDKTGRNRSFYESIRPVIPFLLHLGLTYFWISTSSYDILRKHPRLFFFAVGTVFSNYACRLIVSGMSNTRCQTFNWLLMPLMAIVFGVCATNLGVTEYYLLWAFTIFATAAHIHYGICVVQQLAEHLNIYVFSVKKPAKTD